MSEDWIEAQASIKVKFHLNALTMEEWVNMLQNIPIREKRTNHKRQRKKINTWKKGKRFNRKSFYAHQDRSASETQMNPQMKKEPLNLC